MGLLQLYQSVNYKNVLVIVKVEDGIWVMFVNNYFLFVINLDVVKNQLKMFVDLFVLVYVGKVVYLNLVMVGDGMVVLILMMLLMGEDKVFDYFVKLLQSVKFYMKGMGYLNVLLLCNEISVVNGDLQMDFDDVEYGVLFIKLIFLVVKDGDQLIMFQFLYGIGLIKSGLNQDVGWKLIDYLMLMEVQLKVLDMYGILGCIDVLLVGKNGEVVKKVIVGVKLILVDWIQVMVKKLVWIECWKKDVIGSLGKQFDVVKLK